MIEETTKKSNVSSCIHNMSAPSRTVVKVKPLGRSRSRELYFVPCGFREVYRLNIETVYSVYFPSIKSWPCASQEAAIRRFLALAHLASGIVDEVNLDYAINLPLTSKEKMRDEALEIVTNFDPLEYGLPSAAVVISINPEAKPVNLSPREALAVSSRISNNLFLASHSPYAFISDRPKPFALIVPDSSESKGNTL
jgi:hypothetical protein